MFWVVLLDRVDFLRFDFFRSLSEPELVRFVPISEDNDVGLLSIPISCGSSLTV